MRFVNRILPKRIRNINIVDDIVKKDTLYKNNRLGAVGWLNDPLRSLNFNIPIYNDANKPMIQSCVDIHKKLINRIIEMNKKDDSCYTTSGIYDLGELYLNIIYGYNSTHSSNNNLVYDKIRNIIESRFNYNAISNINMINRSILNIKKCSDSIDIHNYNGDHSFNISQSSNYNFYSELDDDRLSVSTQVESTDVSCSKSSFGFNSISQGYTTTHWSEYDSLRKSSAFFEKNFANLIKVLGANSDYFLNQILSYSVSRMCNNDVQYSCILDSKSVILDTCFVSRLDDHYILITTGNRKHDVFDYISSYAVHLKAFGLDVSVTPLDKYKVANLYGPLSYQVFTQFLTDNSPEISIEATSGPAINSISEEKVVTNHQCDKFTESNRRTNQMGEQGCQSSTTSTNNVRFFMKTFYINFKNKDKKIVCYRVSDVEEGLEFIIPTEYYTEFKDLLLSHDKVIPMGFQTYDIARLESGIVRPDVDLTPDSTPLHSSLMWNVDIEKIRSKIMFGHKNIAHNMVDGVSKMRVGLISNKMLTPSCKVLNKSTRMPIGLVTSSAFSPALGMYISHCYVNRDYAKHDMPVVISVPEKPDEPVSKAKYEKYYRNNVLKTFCLGTIVRLPFIKRTHKITNERKLKSDKITYLKPKIVKKHDQNQLIKAEKKTGIRTKKQIWKEIIKQHKKKVNATFEMACKKWENINEKTNEDCGELGPEAPKTTPDDINSINLENKLEYYKNIIDVSVSGRHRRYRPTTHR